jgi:glycosyltransferase involved in cell wall biosynthesis
MIDSLSVILPVYNEEKDIETVLNETASFLKNNFQKYEIIIVNDGSSDRSADIINNFAKDNPDIVVMNHKKNKGYGCAVRTGIGMASLNYIFFMDADGQFRIEDFNLIKSFIPQYDMVIGFRKQRNDTPFRVLLGKTFTMIINRFYRLNFRDINCAFKLMKRINVQGFELQINGPLINAEILIKAKHSGLKIKEVPIPHYPRLHGQSTGARIDTILKAVEDFFHLLRIL